MESLNSRRSRNTDMELVFLYMGAEPDQWQKLVEVAQEGVRLWQVPRDRAETVDFIYGLRRSKGTHQKTWFLIDERQTIFKTGIINSALQKNDKARSEEHTSELQSLMRISYAVFCLNKKNSYTIKHR